jgi:CheY-like chemotaxis protein
MASSTGDALEKARAQPPTLAFVDITLPDIGGYGLCELLRALPGCDSLTIVLLFDMGQQPDSAKCQALSIEDCVGKPFDPDRIRLLAGRVLGVDVEL